MRMPLRLLPLLLVAVPSCSPSVAPISQLDKARVLALRAEPTELVPDGGVTLDALLYLPPGSPTPTWAWSWCPALDTSYACATTAAALTSTLDPDGGLGLALDFALGSGATATFAYPASPSVLKQLACPQVSPATDAGTDGGSDAGASDDGGALDAGVVFCLNEFTVNVLLTVHVGTTDLRAMRQLTVLLDAPSAPLNANPTILGLTVSPGGLLPDGGTRPDAVYQLLADLADSASETFTQASPFSPQGGPPQDLDAGVGPRDGGMPPRTDAGEPDAGEPDAGVTEADAGLDSDGGSRSQREGLSLAWYVDRGQLESADTTLRQGNAAETRNWTALLENGWTAPDGGGAANFILVVRDTRGGIGWFVQQTTVPSK